MNTPRSSTETLINALRILSRDIYSEDGVANAAISEAADRLEELHNSMQASDAVRTESLNEYHPQSFPHPGETIHELMVELNVTPNDLANATGLSIKYIEAIIRGDEPVWPSLAKALEKLYGISSRLLLKMQKLHRNYIWNRKNHEEDHGLDHVIRWDPIVLDRQEFDESAEPGLDAFMTNEPNGRWVEYDIASAIVGGLKIRNQILNEKLNQTLNLLERVITTFDPLDNDGDLLYKEVKDFISKSKVEQQ
jgi:plasmid maintenance system antidote protein VapI